MPCVLLSYIKTVSLFFFFYFTVLSCISTCCYFLESGKQKWPALSPFLKSPSTKKNKKNEEKFGDASTTQNIGVLKQKKEKENQSKADDFFGRVRMFSARIDAFMERREVKCIRWKSILGVADEVSFLFAIFTFLTGPFTHLHSGRCSEMFDGVLPGNLYPGRSAA